MNLTFYNMMSCKNFDASFMGGCSMAWMGAVVVFLALAVIRKWVFEEALSMEFNFIIAEVTGILSYMALISFIGSFKWPCLLAVIIGSLAGYFSSMLMGGGSDNNYYG